VDQAKHIIESNWRCEFENARSGVPGDGHAVKSLNLAVNINHLVSAVEA